MSIEHQFSTDIIVEIVSRLPSKSVARCRCVSKLWASLFALGSPLFTELFLTQSKTRPHLLLAVERNNDWLLYSCPQPQISHQNFDSSPPVTAEFQISLPKALDLRISPPISGLIYCPNMRNINGRNHPVFCNPSTRQILWLPELKSRENFIRYYVGYDPIDEQFNVLSISYSSQSLEELSSSYRILKMGSGKRLIWRNLECPLEHHVPSYLNTYVNGVLYYVANIRTPYSKIVCFDLNSEEFKIIDIPWSFEPNILVNFKGKLCAITIMWEPVVQRYNLDLIIRVLEDFETEEWSEERYPLPSGLCNNNRADETYVRADGMSVTGDIVLSLINPDSSYYVCFYNPEKNSLKEIEIKGFREFKSAYVFACVDYQEDLRLF